MLYAKPPLAIPEQVQLLKDRGMSIEDDERAARYLHSIGYYRLSAYLLPFINRSQNAQNHQLESGTRFEDVLQLYILDRKLRLIVLEAIERIEVAVRTCWANELSLKAQDAHAFMNPQHFKDPWKHQKNLSKVAHELKENNERFVRHYLDKYTHPYLPPIWAMAETLSFGALSHWYENTQNNKIKASVAKAVGLPTVEVTEGVLHALTLVRNTAAHHSRLWNRQFVKSLPNIKRLNKSLVIEQTNDKHGNTQLQPSKKLYNYLVVISHMMINIQPKTKWNQRLIELLQEFGQSKLEAMGFPNGWETKGVWRSHHE